MGGRFICWYVYSYDLQTPAARYSALCEDFNDTIIFQLSVLMKTVMNELFEVSPE